MELAGEQMIAAPRRRVWASLNDPQVLKACIPGCEEVVRVADNVFEARVLTRVGPLRARFSGRVEMTDIEEPARCTLVFEGGAGSVGMARGRSRVTLDETADGTRLTYAAEAAIGGKLGQIGGRLVDASARKMADDFFRALDGTLNPPTPANDDAIVPAAVPVAGDAVASAAPRSAATGQGAAVGAVFSPGWSGEFQRLLWVVVGVAAGLGIAHFFHP